MNQELFSPTENEIIKLLGKKKTTIKKLTDLFFKNQKKPLNANNVVSGAIRHINLKCAYHRLDWFVNGEGLGRGGKTVWLDKH